MHLHETLAPPLLLLPPQPELGLRQRQVNLRHHLLPATHGAPTRRRRRPIPLVPHARVQTPLLRDGHAVEIRAPDGPARGQHAHGLASDLGDVVRGIRRQERVGAGRTSPRPRGRE
nr:hypothetical protein CFP56_60729 [Quercus suber]